MPIQHLRRFVRAGRRHGHKIMNPAAKASISDHFDGERFRNLDGPPRRPSYAAILKWRASRNIKRWRVHADATPGAPPPAHVKVGQLRVTFINHATFLIQQDGVNILTDPIWSDWIGPASYLGVKRSREPGLRFSDLPHIDAILLSHDHYDHTDLPSLRQVAKRFPHVPVFSGLGTGRLLADHGLHNIHEMDWWQAGTVRGVEIVSVPAKHFSGRGVFDLNRTLWMGFVVRGAAGCIYFAGDTAWGHHFAMIGEHFGSMRAALLPIGAYLPPWVMQHVHLSPSEAVRAAEALRANVSVAMHYGTFQLGDEERHQPVDELHKAIAASKRPPKFWVLNFGEGRDVPPIERPAKRVLSAR